MLKLFNTTQREQGEPQEIQVPGTPTEEEINPLNAAIIYMVTLNFRSSRQPYIYVCDKFVRFLREAKKLNAI